MMLRLRTWLNIQEMEHGRIVLGCVAAVLMWWRSDFDSGSSSGSFKAQLEVDGDDLERDGKVPMTCAMPIYL